MCTIFKLKKINVNSRLYRGQEGPGGALRDLEVKRAGSLREGEEERAGSGILKVAGTAINMRKIRNIA